MTYKYFRIIPTSSSAVTVTPDTSFPQGDAPNNLTLHIGSADGPPNNAGHFGRLEISGNGAGFTVVDPANYDLDYGSIHVALAQRYLNTLAPGNYTLHIYLAGAFVGAPLTADLTVTAPGSADAPKTGDGTPLAMLALLMLLSCGGVALLLTRKRLAQGDHSFSDAYTLGDSTPTSGKFR